MSDPPLGNERKVRAPLICLMHKATIVAAQCMHAAAGPMMKVARKVPMPQGAPGCLLCRMNPPRGPLQALQHHPPHWWALQWPAWCIWCDTDAV